MGAGKTKQAVKIVIHLGSGNNKIVCNWLGSSVTVLRYSLFQVLWFYIKKSFLLRTSKVSHFPLFTSTANTYRVFFPCGVSVHLSGCNIFHFYNQRMNARFFFHDENAVQCYTKGCSGQIVDIQVVLWPIHSACMFQCCLLCSPGLIMFRAYVSEFSQVFCLMFSCLLRKA